MNIQSIKYLAALAKYSHFGKAAKMCFVSQPTLSMQIKKLEDRLGVQLLERNNKSVRLTEVGTLIAEHARNILRETEAIKEHAQAAKDPYSGQLKIGVIPTIGPYFLPILFPQLTASFPRLTCYLTELHTYPLLEELKQGHLDVAILAWPLPVEEPQLTGAAFFEEEFFLAVPKGHAWAERKTIPIADLADQNLLLLNEDHCLREQTLAVCQQANAHEMENFRATSLETLRHMVASGVGITLIPKLARRPGDGLAYIPFAGVKPSRTLALVWRKCSHRQQLFQDLTNHIHALSNTIR